jgi:hypothetical protein
VLDITLWIAVIFTMTACDDNELIVINTTFVRILV